MPASDVAIANLALTKLGADRIIALTDNTKEAREVNAIYELERDNEIRAHFWKFATARTALPALTTPPAFGYNNAFQLPSDYLRVVAVGDFAPGAVDRWFYYTGTDNSEYQIEGQTIVTDFAAPLNLRYMRRITDPTQFDANFVEAFACKLAIELCETLTSSSSKKADCARSYQMAISNALRANAIEQPPEPQTSGTWLMARLPG